MQSRLQSHFWRRLKSVYSTTTAPAVRSETGRLLSEQAHAWRTVRGKDMLWWEVRAQMELPAMAAGCTRLQNRVRRTFDVLKKGIDR